MHDVSSSESTVLTRRGFLWSGVPAVAGTGVTAGCVVRVPDLIEQTSHRPWPLPQRPWRLFMRWHELVFLHWPVRPQLLQPLIPPHIELDTFDGRSWIGVVAFRMSGVRPRWVPFSFAFPELNVRTYVKTPGRPGVWFFSLDATSWIAVRAARWQGLPYYDARISVRLETDTVHYRSVRIHKNAAPAELDASYRPTGAMYRAAPDTLDHWLTERYSLYSADHAGRVVYGEIHHLPWPLQRAETELRLNSMTAPMGFELPSTKPEGHFARCLEVVAWPIERYRSQAGRP
jgi:uncharacterized protein YqjF (DUF2071 family)